MFNEKHRNCFDSKRNLLNLIRIEKKNCTKAFEQVALVDLP